MKIKKYIFILASVLFVNTSCSQYLDINDDPNKGVRLRWRAHANLLFTNWLNYYVYQETPYRIEDIK